MTIQERNLKLKKLITCLKCKASRKICYDKSVYYIGNIEEIIENLIAISKYISRSEKTGDWVRLSDLPERVDRRYKCSNCGNVVRHDSRANLYIFNRWCGRCGSDNGRRVDKKYE